MTLFTVTPYVCEVSSRPRRTQAERRTATRGRILDCTADCLLERGYTATTVSEVQQRSGLARGTIQHHFPTRAQLIVGAMSHLVDTRISRFREEAALIAPGPGRMQAVVDLAWRDLSSPIFFAALELWVAARTDAELRATLVPEQDRLFAAMRELYAETLGEPYTSDPRVETLVEFTVDLLTGLSLATMLSSSAGSREAVLRRWKRALAVLAGVLPADELLGGRSLSELLPPGGTMTP
nr:TetR/AcrR family transcriptional regulator [Nocardioides thalensis]